MEAGGEGGVDGDKTRHISYSLPLHLHAWKLVEREVWRLAGILDPYSPSYSGKTLEEPSVILNARR